MGCLNLERRREVKTLYLINMIHTPEELGSLGADVKKTHIKQFGQVHWDNFLLCIRDYWEEVSRRIMCIDTGLTKFSIFVDSLPDIEEKTVNEIVRNLIESKKIPMYQIINQLIKMDKGEVYGTEDLELIVEEYKYYSELAQGGKIDVEASKERLIGRDKYIAKRIEDVIKDDGYGVLFIGKAHNVIDYLPDTFTVINL